VVANQSATFSGGDHLDYQVAQLPDRDDLDSWAFELDNSEDRADSANYVSREMTGYEDLDEYGDWSYVAGLRVPAGALAPWSWDGLHIVSVIGFMLAAGAGPGSKTSRGDSPPSTTGLGRLSTMVGSGCPGPVG